jgi:hypothetical protein
MNISDIAEGERPSSGVMVASWVNVGVNVLFGLITFYGLAKDRYDTPVYLGIGITSLAWGGINCGLTLWASAQPERKEQKLTLTPMIMPDSRGNAALGVGLRLVDW